MDLRSRLSLAAALTLLPLLPLALRLAKLQVLDHRHLETRAADEFSRSAQEVTPRADILDRHGKILAQSQQAWNVFVDKRMAKKAADVARPLGAALKMAPDEVARRYRGGTPKFAVIKKGLSFDEAQSVRHARIEGVGLEASQERFYPNGGLARSLLGQVSSDGKGIAGVELALDKRLTGKARRFKVIRDGAGKMIHRSVEQDEPAPDPTRLTIDRSVQYFAEEALGEAAQKFNFTQGVAVVQDPNNGDILAMAVHPPNPLKNPLVQDTYEPGSTFKVITAAAALDERIVREEESFDTEGGKWTIAPGTTISDDHEAASLNLAGILRESSNIGIAKVVERLGASRFSRYARAFGFAAKTGISLPGEASGEVRPLQQMTRVGLAASSYGYGVAATAMQMVGAYSAIANGGTLYEPRVVLDGKEPAAVRRVASEQTMKRISEMLEGVVEGGTGTTAKIPGYRVAGKTGTARKVDPNTKKYSTSMYNASFAGFLPASAPRWTILVVIENPKGSIYGAQVAAPVFARIGRQLLARDGVAQDRPATEPAAAAPAPHAPAMPPRRPAVR